MEENPFTITEKVIPKYFCDRKQESAQLIKLLTNRNNVVLISQRRIGKTGLIQYCFEQKALKRSHYTFYIDILSTTNLKEFTFLLGKVIYEGIRPLGKRMISSFFSIVKSLSTKIGFDPLSGLPSLNIQLGDITQPEFTLKEIFEYLNSAEKPCIVAIDEFQQISKYPEKGVEALLRSHLLQINNCRFIFSGSEQHLLAEMFLKSARPFYMSASILELKVIPRDVYVDFILKMFKQGDKLISNDFAGEIYDTFEGYTFYVQKVCNIVFASTKKGESATKEMFYMALNEILYSYDTLYREQLSRLSTRQKELLFAIANKGRIDKITSTEFIRENSLSSASSVQTSLKSLMKSGVVVSLEKSYWIDDRFFSLWIKRNYCNG